MRLTKSPKLKKLFKSIIFNIQLLYYFKIYCWFYSIRSESPSSQRSSPPISPGCEDQLLDMPMHLHDPFKKPLPPLRPQDFPHFYSGYPYHLIQHGGSAFHRPVDANGKPLPVSMFTIYT